jgi:hypothetical protein
MRKIVLLRDEPTIQPEALETKLESEWLEIPQPDQEIYQRVANKRNAQVTGVIVKQEIDSNIPASVIGAEIQTTNGETGNLEYVETMIGQ